MRARTIARGLLANRYLREPFIVLLAYIPYFLARGHAVANANQAFHNANDVIQIEENLGIFQELSVQSVTFSYGFLTHAFNMIYFYGHWPVIIGLGVYLFVRHPKVYTMTRNAFLISGACALVLYAVFPVAPPRLIGQGFVDTLQLTVPVSLDKSRLVNPFAALPSLHVGWNLLIALGVFVASRHWAIRYPVLLLPVAMMIATVATGNHYFIDGIAGAALGLSAFMIAAWLQPRWPGAQERALTFVRTKVLRRLEPAS